ncbi:hypothetical protein [Aphanothece sacrum]|nr:hypothetical protein [Aphanothece sacrum]
MNQTITAIFDGQVLKPETPLNLEPNQRYTITITSETTTTTNNNGWDVIESLIGTVDAPDDWSLEHDTE